MDAEHMDDDQPITMTAISRMESEDQVMVVSNECLRLHGAPPASPSSPFVLKLPQSNRRPLMTIAAAQQASASPLTSSATFSSLRDLQSTPSGAFSFNAFRSPLPKLQMKRPRCFGLDRSNSLLEDLREEPLPKREAPPMLHRSMSESNALSIMRACDARADQPNRTADTSRPLSLPTLRVGAKHQDLNTIDCHTLAKLLKGEYTGVVDSFRIIDARYVYEFEGGHVIGAENFGAWDEDNFWDEFLPPHLKPRPIGSHEDGENARREILIFHCEFSSARGPALMRDLRKRDRCLNSEAYPALHYPECYLLHNGYKEFYENYPELCDPHNYVPMTDPNFSRDEKMFRKKSKSWAAGSSGFSRVGPFKSSKSLKMDRLFQ